MPGGDFQRNSLRHSGPHWRPPRHHRRHLCIRRKGCHRVYFLQLPLPIVFCPGWLAGGKLISPRLVGGPPSQAMWWELTLLTATHRFVWWQARSTTPRPRPSLRTKHQRREGEGEYGTYQLGASTDEMQLWEKSDVLPALAALLPFGGG